MASNPFLIQPNWPLRRRNNSHIHATEGEKSQYALPCFCLQEVLVMIGLVNYKINLNPWRRRRGKRDIATISSQLTLGTSDRCSGVSCHHPKQLFYSSLKTFMSDVFSRRAQNPMPARPDSHPRTRCYQNPRPRLMSTLTRILSSTKAAVSEIASDSCIKQSCHH